jgi:hypothetical protein
MVTEKRNILMFINVRYFLFFRRAELAELTPVSIRIHKKEINAAVTSAARTMFCQAHN